MGFITLVAVPIIAIGSVVLISKFFNSRNGGEKPTDEPRRQTPREGSVLDVARCHRRARRKTPSAPNCIINQPYGRRRYRVLDYAKRSRRLSFHHNRCAYDTCRRCRSRFQIGWPLRGKDKGSGHFVRYGHSGCCLHLLWRCVNEHHRSILGAARFI